METKVQIAKATLTLLTVVTILFLSGLFVLALCAGLQINPFKETTTEILLSTFMGLTGVAAVLVLLSVATNLSLIADAKIGSSISKHAVVPEKVRGGICIGGRGAHWCGCWWNVSV